MKFRAKTVVAAGAAALLAGCMVIPVEQAGGDDFPNMIASAGTSISENLNQQWENPAAASSDALSGIEQTAIPEIPTDFFMGKRLSLAKRAVTDSVRFDISPTGRISVFYYSSTDSTISRDTLLARVVDGDTLLVALRGELVRTKLLPIFEWYRYADYDGDSILINPRAEKQQASGFYKRQFPSGRTETVSVVVDAGADRDFQTDGDNRYLSFFALVSLAADTISFAELRDADGDGFVVDKGSTADSCLVDIVTQSNELLQPANTTTARMVVFPNDSTRNYAIRYGIVNRFPGRTVRWSIVEAGEDSSFFPGDTVSVTRVVEPAGSDSITADTLRLRAVLGANPRDSLDDALIGIYLHSTFRLGADREVLFKWNAATPLKSGQTPRDGTVFYKSVFADNQCIEVTGTISETVITAEVSTSGGKRYAVTWDTTGKQLSIRELVD